MIYETAEDWRAAPRKAVALLGMSGVGKTRIGALLREEGDWFHYSVDYRIGTRYLDEEITDDFKREAMKNPYLRELLRSDSIYIASNLSFHNLSPLSTWLGKPGDPEKGGIPFDDYLDRQRLHRKAEIAAMLDARAFIDRARSLYQYDHFVCDTSGSICEVVEPSNPDDPVLNALYQSMLPVYIRGTEAHEEALKTRFDRAPKPMYYQESFLKEIWADYLAETNGPPEKVDPDAFIRHGFARLLAHRRPRYQAIADRWGVTVEADDIAGVETGEDFSRLVSDAIEKRAER
ncbi:ATPase [Pikeienuella piscinae]|uniref:ATPase n=1 Tax=Pikeienuella piscinae TaxID=2748098 RepID=A0A7L5BV18_9RHOB|nr:ATPase [Pikeienuella piscinae]QIE54006.1 ATPase [Pikeienuella piscinae]